MAGYEPKLIMTGIVVLFEYPLFVQDRLNVILRLSGALLDIIRFVAVILEVYVDISKISRFKHQVIRLERNCMEIPPFRPI